MARSQMIVQDIDDASNLCQEAGGILVLPGYSVRACG